MFNEISQFIASNAVALGFVSAAIGLIGKHFSDRHLRIYEARLAFVRDQLKYLYGPLFLLSKANDKTWREFRRIVRPGEPLFNLDKPLTDTERTEYIHWVETVFSPSNAKIRIIIETNAHLFLEGSAPAAALDLLTHFDALDIVLSKFKNGTDRNVFPATGYPKEFGAYISKAYAVVVKRHANLTAQRRT